MWVLSVILGGIAQKFPCSRPMFLSSITDLAQPPTPELALFGIGLDK